MEESRTHSCQIWRCICLAFVRSFNSFWRFFLEIPERQVTFLLLHIWRSWKGRKDDWAMELGSDVKAEKREGGDRHPPLFFHPRKSLRCQLWLDHESRLFIYNPQFLNITMSNLFVLIGLLWTAANFETAVTTPRRMIFFYSTLFNFQCGQKSN